MPYAITCHGRYVSSRQIMFRPIQYTDIKKNVAIFETKAHAERYAAVNCFNYQIVKV